MGERKEIMMPMEPAAAAQQIEIEVLRQISANLTRLNDRADKQSELIAEQTKMLHHMDARLIRIEANKLDRTVEQLTARLESIETALSNRIDALETDRDHRLGALRAAEWLARVGPWLMSLLLALAILAYSAWRGGFGK